MENLQSQSGQAHARKKSMILVVFESLNNLGTCKPFMVNKSHFKTGDVLQKQYKFVVGTVFYHHLKFAAQRDLRVEVFNLGHKLTDIPITKKVATSISTNTSGTKRKQSCAEDTATSYINLSLQLTTCAVVTNDQVCNGCNNPTLFVYLFLYKYKLPCYSMPPPVPTSFTIIEILLLPAQTTDLDTESATKLTSPIKDNIDHNDPHYDYGKISHTTNWSNHCLCPMSYLKRCVCTALIVLHEECVYQIWSSNFEVYSAGMLLLNRHSRITRSPRMLNDLETATSVIPEKDSFHIDKNDVLHVYRNGSLKMN